MVLDIQELYSGWTVQPLVGGAIQLLQARFWERVAGRLALSLVATLGDHALQNFEHLAVWERWY